MKKRFVFVETDADLSKSIADLLQETVWESECRMIRCADGVDRNLWKIDVNLVPQVFKFQKDKGEGKCNFFVQTGEGIVPVSVEMGAESPELQALKKEVLSDLKRIKRARKLKITDGTLRSKGRTRKVFRKRQKARLATRN